MTEDSDRQRVLVSALRFLSASPKSRNELAGKLGQKGFPGEVIHQVLNDLEEKGLLNDKGLASELSNRFTKVKPSGRRKLAFELKRRGIPADIREEIVTSVSDEDEARMAKEAAAGKWARLRSLEPDKRRKRIADFLLRRGFHYGTVKEAIEELEREQSHEG